MHLVAIGGSDAGISAALRARELDPTTEVTVVVADAYPNFSICGIPYYVSGEVTHWQNLAHRTLDDLKATGMQVRLNTMATKIEVAGRRLHVIDDSGVEDQIAYDKLVVGTGAISARPPIEGLVGPEALGPGDGVHLLHSMGDTFELVRTIEESEPANAMIVGAGYIGLEMAEGLRARGLEVTQFEQLPEVLPTVDPSLGALVNAELTAHGVDVRTSTTVKRISAAPEGSAGRFQIDAVESSGTELTAFADLVLVVVGVRPDTALAASAGAELGLAGAICVDRGMRTNLERRLRCRRLRRHAPPIVGPHLPAARDHRPQAGPGGRRERHRAEPGVHRQPRDPGRQDLRHGGVPHRVTRSRGGCRRLRPGDGRVRGRRPQGVLPGQPPDPDAIHGRPSDRQAPGRPALRPSAC